MAVVKLVTVGMDVGQQHDPTAIAVAIAPFPGAPHLRLATVKHLERLPLGTGYVEVKDRILNILHNLEVAFFVEIPGRYTGEVRVDATGVGRPLVDMLHEAEPKARIYGVTLTAGHEQTRKGWDWYCPKQHLVNTLTRYMAERRLYLPNTEEARAFQRELRAFQGRKESANHIETGARSGSHDDLVIAVGLSLLSSSSRQRPPRQHQALLGEPMVDEKTGAMLGYAAPPDRVGLDARQQRIQAAAEAMTSGVEEFNFYMAPVVNEEPTRRRQR